MLTAKLRRQEIKASRRVQRVEECSDPIHDLAVQAVARSHSKSSYSPAFIEFAQMADDGVIAADLNAIFGRERLEPIRRKLAQGLPVGELTRRDGKSVVDYDPQYRLAKAA